ncbi:hypothetical protein [Altererythrobacter sp.]|uniref:COG3650 family protein n=1 Tax=Altererythrobacter sp. TaxID=1872480 RepID=UPI001B09617D|nr:hypothetical protein [Altererythrobacter sp.]MBO6642587.1 hypothetical protein [Altererythrobacter sp.]MBO6708905.1 hypothetical protein [Altererythrobacter sp.]MBO6944986.1 hypothetical protein [Altererythrobacter sp.]MDX1702714.1 hypothetical protein [Altererythrobacter ishigakiensis]
MIGKEFAKRLALSAAVSLGLYACFGGAEDAPGDVETFDGIADGETINALGNEPFWSAKIEAEKLTYTTPENMAGDVVAVKRFAGNGGLGISGELAGAPLHMAVTPGECSDTMSDRSYPFTVTLTLGETQLNGCAYTESQPYSGEETEG